MARDIFQLTVADTVNVLDTIGTLRAVMIPLADIEVIVYAGDTYNTPQQANATVYQDASSGAEGPSPESGATGAANQFTTGASGLIEFWADYNRYDVLIRDTQTPARIPQRVVKWNAGVGPDNSIAGSKIADNAIGNRHLGDDVVTANEIADNAVGQAQIAANGVGGPEIADDAIANRHLGPDVVTGAEIADNAISVEHMQDNAVDNAVIATNAVNARVLAEADDYQMNNLNVSGTCIGGALQCYNYLYFNGGELYIRGTNGGNAFVTPSSGNWGTMDALAFNTRSDMRGKDAIRTIKSAVEKLKSVRGVEFEWEEGTEEQIGQTSIGVVAQEVQAVFPDAVVEMKSAPVQEEHPETGELVDVAPGETRLGVNLGAMVGILTEAVRELSTRLDALEGSAKK